MSGYGSGLFGDGPFGGARVAPGVPEIVGDVIAVRKGTNPLATNRSSRYRIDLLDSTGLKFGELDGVSSGSIEWNANSQVKGGGRIVVSKANDVHKREIRVVKNRPVVGDQDFETDTGGWAYNAEFSTHYEPAYAVTRSTTTFYEGGAALDIEWNTASTDPEITHQNVVGYLGELIAGQSYTVVARILNTEATSALAKVSFFTSKALPVRPDWQTVVLNFTADTSGDCYFGVANGDAILGQHTFIDSAVLYDGYTTGYNGEAVEYAPFSWMHARVRPVLEIDGMPEEPLGVFIPTAPVEQWDEGGGRQEIELLDRTSIISQDYVDRAYSVPKNANVISEVRKIIASTGERVGALTASDETLNSDMTWGAGTNKLTIINELLDAAGFFSLWADGNGQFRVEKYRAPKNRPVAFQLLDDANSIYLPNLSIDRDIYSVPNKVIMTAQGDGQSEGWSVVATNENESSPFSYQRRGRWVTDVQLGVEATSLESLQSKAEKRLRSLSSLQSTVEINHAPVPGLKVNDVVRFRRNPADVDTLFTVTKTSINLDPTSLAKTTLTEVVDL